MSDQKQTETTNKPISPLLWVFSTFFMEGFPGLMIMTVTTIMYKNMGVSNEKITFYTGMLMLPWVIKPFWASFIDIIKTKAWWIYTMEICASIGFVALAFSLQTPFYFTLSLTFCWVIAFMSSSHDIATDGFYLVTLKPEQQSLFLGFQSAAYQVGKIFAQGLMVMLSGYLFSKLNNYFTVWTIIMLIAGVITFAVGIYHSFILSKASHAKEVKELHSFKSAMKQFVLVYKEFFAMKGLVFSILFLGCYKVGESMLLNILPLFLLDPISKGGLGLNNQFTGFVYGVTSPIAILLAGLLGGYCIYKKGLKFWIWWMLIIMHVPNVFYVFLAKFQIQNHAVVLGFITIEQFCFSFGYCAYSIFLMYTVRNSRFKTAHYSFFSGIMLLMLMCPRMISGWIQQQIGYEHFFILILFMIIPAGIVVKMLKLDPLYGKKATNK